jgi:hypothetical protein
LQKTTLARIFKFLALIPNQVSADWTACNDCIILSSGGFSLIKQSPFGDRTSRNSREDNSGAKTKANCLVALNCGCSFLLHPTTAFVQGKTGGLAVE